MVTVDYSELLEGVCDLIGIGVGEILAVDANRIRRLLNKRLRTAWEWRFWPDTVKTQQRWFRKIYDSSETHAQGYEVFDVLTGKYWIRADDTLATFVPGAGNEWVEARKSYGGPDFVAGTAYAAGTTLRYPADDRFYFVWETTNGSQAPTDTEYFVALTPFEAYVDLNQDYLDPIGLVRECWNKDPRIRLDAVRLDWFRGADRVNVRSDIAYAWIEFQGPAPMLLGDVLDPTSTHSAGDRRYFSDNFYLCLSAATAGQTPATHPNLWALQQIPVEFQRYLEQGTYADWLPSDGQNDRRQAESKIADQYLGEVAMRLMGVQGQNNQTRVMTR